MSTRSWVRNLFVPRAPRTTHTTTARHRLAVEALEDRALLSVSFLPAVTYGAGPMSSSVAAGDFNADGRPDLAVANWGTSYTSADGGVSVLLNNPPPTIQADLPTVTGDEGTQVPTSGTFDAAGGRGAVALTASLGTVTKNDATGTWNWTYTPPDGTAGPTTVTLTATDTGGLTATTSFNLSVNNVAPTITSVTVPAIAPANTAIAVSAQATDPAGTRDPLIYRWTLTPPNGSGVLGGTSESSSPNELISVGNPGTYTLLLEVLDDEGGRVGESTTIVVRSAPTIQADLPTVTGDEVYQVPTSGTFDAAGGRGAVALTASLGTVTKNDATGAWNWTYTPPDGTAGPTTVTLTATDTGGLTATTSFTLNVSVPTAGEKFIQNLYQNELGRSPGASGVAHWLTVLGSGGRSAVVNGIANSTEARARRVSGWFQTYLGRTADAATVTAFAATLAGQTEEQMVSGILGSQEFFNRAQTMGFGGTPDQNYVRALYQSVLGRTASSAEVDGHVAALGQVGRPGLALTFLQSREYRTNVVRGYYADLLHRPGSAAEIAAWASSNLDVRAIRLAFESSDEFFVNG